MAKGSNIVFITLNVIVWIIFVGLCIEAGGLIVNFFFSIFKPESIPYLYQKLDISIVYERSKSAFFLVYGLILSISLLKAYLFFVVIKLSLKFTLSNPFNSFVLKHITTISYITLAIGLLSLIAQQITQGLIHRGYEVHKLTQLWNDGQAFLLMAAVIYLIAAIFRKGLEIQNENDLTV